MSKISLKNIGAAATEAVAEVAESKQKRRRAAKNADESTDRVIVLDWEPDDFFKVKLDGEGKFKDVTILQNGLIDLLLNMGFRRFEQGETGFMLVRIVDNIAEPVTIWRLREAVMRHARGLAEPLKYSCPKKDMLEKLSRSLETLTSDGRLSAMLVNMEVDETFEFVTHTEKNAYFFYQNGWVDVSADKMELRDYKELPGLVWREQILPRNFEKVKLSEIEASDYYRFCQNVSGTGRAEPKNGHDIERFSAFMCLTGYLLHQYFGTEMKCGIFMDARVSEDPDGRSGKSLHTKAIGHMMVPDVLSDKTRLFQVIDGKKFKDDNQFALDQVKREARLVIFDDIKRDFKIEDFFNAIVDGLIIELKGGVKYRVRTKMIFTLNYSISIHGGSAKDRVVEFEWADYYSSQYKPISEFGRAFFTGWDEKEWNLFDNFMLTCVREYFKYGILNAKPINMNAIKLRNETNAEFVAFMEEKVQHAIEYDKKDLLKELADIDDNGKARFKDFAWMKVSTLTKWLKLYAEYSGHVAGYQMRRSNGKELFRFIFNEPTGLEILDDDKNPPVLFAGKSDLVRGEVVAEVAGGKLPF